MLGGGNSGAWQERRACFRRARRALLPGSDPLTIPAALRDQRDAQGGNGDRHATSKTTIHL